MIPELAVWIIAAALAIVALPTLIVILFYLLAAVALGALAVIDKVTP